MTQAIHAAFEFFARGGFFMIVLLFLSVFALAVILFRAAALRVNLICPPDLESAVEGFNPGETTDRLAALAGASHSPLGRILSVCIAHLRWPRQENVEAVQMRARHEIVRMESGLVLLEVATGIAPLLGLLGTLSGLVGIFSNIGEGGDPAVVARGISEALNTTIVGLAVAVVCLVAYNYFQRKVETMAVSMEGAAADLMAKCYGAEV